MAPFSLALLLSGQHGAERRRQLLQVKQRRVGLRPDGVPPLVVRGVRDETCREKLVLRIQTRAGRPDVWREGARLHTGAVGLHEAERPVVQRDGQEAEVVRVAHACCDKTSRQA